MSLPPVRRRAIQRSDLDDPVSPITSSNHEPRPGHVLLLLYVSHVPTGT